MSAEYKNFYENLPEANMRLQGTTVMYDGEPYVVNQIIDGYPDGIFRLFLAPLGLQRVPLPETFYMVQGRPEERAVLDKWVETEEVKKLGIIRKHINSPKFNRFRPFDLGMCNVNGSVYYLERTPTRRTFQGMTQAAMMESLVTLGEVQPGREGGRNVMLQSKSVRDTIVGEYPPLDDVLKNLSDPNVHNNAAAFNRHFAVLRGPMDLLFLAHKTEVVGFIDGKTVKMDKKYRHLREKISELSFKEIIIKE